MFLDRDHSIAPPGYSRWRVPPAALAIHLAIGQAYAFSVFNLPLSTLVGIAKPAPSDWKLSTIGWIFSTAIVFLGLSAFAFGRWLEEAGPRKAMFCAATCFAGGFFVAALGVHLHEIWVIYLGYGVIGGIGLGLGYISPVSTLIKWFPDRPGMATGLAIMGFGGGAMIGSPLAVALMAHFKTPASMGVAETFLAMGALYFVFMMFGVFTVRLPAPGWVPMPEARRPEARRPEPREPEAREPEARKPEARRPEPREPEAREPEARKPEARKLGAGRVAPGADVHVDEAFRTKQFWLLWAVLCLNVTAGIGVLGQASPMIQEMFPGVIGAAAAAGFVGLLSLANMIGRFAWSTCSDLIGRRTTYMIFFVLGAALYALIPTTGRIGSVTYFVAFYAVILSMYGGGFATIPAYLRDLFGVMHVGAIHGRLLTAWSVAGVAGPVLVNYIREYQIAHGVAKANAYSVTMYIMAGLLVLGFIANALVMPVDSSHRWKGAHG